MSHRPILPRARRHITAFVFLLGWAASPAANAREVFVVRTLTIPQGSCPATGWRDHLHFYNTTSLEQRVRPLGASNGYQIPLTQDLLIPPQQSRSVVHGVNYSGGVTNDWTPPAVGQPVLLVNKLEVPDGVLLESRMEIYGIAGAEVPCPQGPVVGLEVAGHFAFPVIERLSPPNTLQYHLAADLGTLTSRTNIGVYNGEETGGTATVEMRAACNDRVLETRSVAVPANSLVYVQGFRNTFAETTCVANTGAANYSRYVVVTLDRSGFSFVAARAETLPSRVTVGSTTPR